MDGAGISSRHPEGNYRCTCGSGVNVKKTLRDVEHVAKILMSLSHIVYEVRMLHYNGSRTLWTKCTRISPGQSIRTCSKDSFCRHL